MPVSEEDIDEGSDDYAVPQGSDKDLLEDENKEPEEIALTEEAARFADLFLRHLHAVGGDIISQGGTEADLMAAGMSHARGALIESHGTAFAGTPMGITASVHSGPRAALPHGAVLARRPHAARGGPAL